MRTKGWRTLKGLQPADGIGESMVDPATITFGGQFLSVASEVEVRREMPMRHISAINVYLPKPVEGVSAVIVRTFRVSLQPDKDIDFESWRARLFVPVTATASDGSEAILGQARLEGTADAPTAIVNVDSQRWTEVVGNPDCPCAAYAGPYKILMGV
jgi:hypothetical protein